MKSLKKVVFQSAFLIKFTRVLLVLVVTLGLPRVGIAPALAEPAPVTLINLPVDLQNSIFEFMPPEELEVPPQPQLNFDKVYFKVLRRKGNNDFWKARAIEVIESVASTIYTRLDATRDSWNLTPGFYDIGSTYARKQPLSASAYQTSHADPELLLMLEKLQYLDWDQLALLVHLYDITHLNRRMVPRSNGEEKVYKELSRLSKKEEKSQLGKERSFNLDREVTSAKEEFKNSGNYLKSTVRGKDFTGCRCGCQGSPSLNPIYRGMYGIGGVFIGAFSSIDLGYRYSKRGIESVKDCLNYDQNKITRKRDSIVDRLMSKRTLYSSILNETLARTGPLNETREEKWARAQADLELLKSNLVLKEVVQHLGLEHALSSQILNR